MMLCFEKSLKGTHLEGVELIFSNYVSRFNHQSGWLVRIQVANNAIFKASNFQIEVSSKVILNFFLKKDWRTLLKKDWILRTKGRVAWKRYLLTWLYVEFKQK